MIRLLAVFLLGSVAVWAQANDGELHLDVTDPAGLPVKATVDIVSEANQYHHTFTADDAGNVVAKRLPYGVYRLEIHQAGFADAIKRVEVRSALPTAYAIKLVLSPVNTSVKVSAANTSDRSRPGRLGQPDRLGPDSEPARLDSGPLHAGPGEFAARLALRRQRRAASARLGVSDAVRGRWHSADRQSLAQLRPGDRSRRCAIDEHLHRRHSRGIRPKNGRRGRGQHAAGFAAGLSRPGGAFRRQLRYRRRISRKAQYVWGKNTLGASASGSMTDHYLNPVVPQNYTNTGTIGDFSVRLRARPDAERPAELERPPRTFALRAFPTSRCSRPPGQLPDRRQFRNHGHRLLPAHFFVERRRRFSRHGARQRERLQFQSRIRRPIEVFQHNWFREGYFKGTVTIDHGRHEWKAGVESDNIFLNENFSYIITDPDASSIRRHAARPSAFAGEPPRPRAIRIRAGSDPPGKLDHQRRTALGSLSASAESAGGRPALRDFALFPLRRCWCVHFSYDRVFQTPSFENILLSSSTAVESLDPRISCACPSSLRKAITTKLGLTKAFFEKLKLDANYFRRLVNNYADDDQIDNTTISFPIAFRKAIIYGAEGKLDVPDWHRFSGFLSYSYMVGNAWFPVTGGLFSATTRSAYPAHRPFPGFAGSAQHRSRPPALSGRAALLDRRRHSIRHRPAVRFRRRPTLDGARRNTASRSESHQFRSRPYLSFLPGQRLGRRRSLQVGPPEDAVSGGRRKSHQRPGCHRLRRPFLRQRHRTAAQLRPASYDKLLSSGPFGERACQTN